MSDVNSATQTQQGQAGTAPEGQQTNTDLQLPTTPEELQKILQSETDKRVTQAIKTAQQKWEAEFGQKLESEKKEAARLAKLTAEQREKEVFEKQKADFEKQQKEFQKTQLLNETMVELQKESLPVNFAKHLLGETAEDVMENIKAFKQEWQDALQKAVDERLKGNTPKKGAADVKSSTNFMDAINKNKIR